MSHHKLTACITFVAMACAAPRASASENLIRDGDFERAFTTIQEIPESWTIWGSREGKIYTNYVRDTKNPHGGRACLRIFRPANDNAWFSVFVNTPNRNQIRPKPGMRYTVSFWARTDTPGASTVRVASYKRVNPFVDGPSIKTHTFDAHEKWTRVSFSFCDGADFFASVAKHVYLGFFPAASAEQRNKPKTLWLDDVSVTEERGPEGVQDMIDPETLEVPPVPLRVREGETIDVTVDVTRKLRDTNLMAGGVSMLSLNRWIGTPYSREGKYNLHPALERGFRDLNLPWTRFYGVIEDEPFGTVEEALDAIVFFLDKVGIPRGTVMVELEHFLADSVMSGEIWAGAVEHARQKEYGIRYWEIGNEIYASIWGSHGKAFPDPDVYIDHFRDVAKAIRAVDPEAQIGLSIPRNNHRWGNYVMNATKGHYDFVCPHFYGGFGNIETTPFEDIVISENHQRLTNVQEMNALLKAYSPDRETYIYDSEWGLHASSNDGKHADHQPRNASILGTVYRAVRLLYYAREDLMHGASGWKSLTRTQTPGFAVLYNDEPETRSMLYWLYYYFNRSLGEQVLDIQGTVPYYTSAANKTSDPLTPVMATANEAGDHVYLMLVNGSWRKSIPASIGLPGFRIAKHEAVLLSHDDIDALPHLEKKSDFVHGLDVSVAGEKITFTMPAHSIAFIELWKEAPDERDAASATDAVHDASRADAPSPEMTPADAPASRDDPAPKKEPESNSALLIGLGAVFVIVTVFVAMRLAGGARRRKRKSTSRNRHKG